MKKLNKQNLQRKKLLFRINKKNKYRFISLFLIVLLLAGCGSTDEITDPDSYDPVVINAGDGITEDIIIGAQEAMVMLNAKYIEAVIKTNSVIYADPNSIEFEEWSIYVDNAALAWDEVIEQSEKLKELAASIDDVEISAKPFGTGFYLSWLDLLSSKASADNPDIFPIDKEDFLPLDNPYDNMLYDVYFSQSSYGQTEVSIVDKKQMARVIYDSAPAYKTAIDDVSDFYGIDAAEARDLIEDGLKQRENWDKWKTRGLIGGEVVSRIGRLLPSTFLTIGAIGAAAVAGTPLTILAGCALAIGTGVSYGISLHDELVYISGAIRDESNKEIENYLILKNNPVITRTKTIFDLSTAVMSLTDIKNLENFLVVADLMNQIMDLPEADSYEQFNGITEEYLLMPGEYFINGTPLTIENYDGWMPLFNETDYEFQGWDMEIPGMVWPGEAGTYVGTFEYDIHADHSGTVAGTLKAPMHVEVFPDGRVVGEWEASGSYPNLGINNVSINGNIEGVSDNGNMEGSGVFSMTMNAGGSVMSDSYDMDLSGNISGDLMQLKIIAGGITMEYELIKQ